MSGLFTCVTHVCTGCFVFGDILLHHMLLNKQIGNTQMQCKCMCMHFAHRHTLNAHLIYTCMHSWIVCSHVMLCFVLLCVVLSSPPLSCQGCALVFFTRIGASIAGRVTTEHGLFMMMDCLWIFGIQLMC